MQISYKKRIVKNMGNYESISVEIGMEDEVNFEVDTYETAYGRLRETVNHKLKKEIHKVRLR